VQNTQLLQSGTSGTIAGEGAACFVLGTEPGPQTAAMLSGLTTIYNPASAAEITADIRAFLAAHECTEKDIDLLITGRNGDVRGDAVYEEVEQELLPGRAIACFKHLCGEYPTASSFGMWLAARILAGQQMPAGALFKGT